MARLTLAFLLCLFLLCAAQALPSAHPRLFFGAEDLPALRSKVLRAPFDAMYAQLHSDLFLTRWGNGPAVQGDVGDMLLVARRLAFTGLLDGNTTSCTLALGIVLNATEGPLGGGTWANASTFGLLLYGQAVNVALVLDWCALLWPAASAARVSAALAAQAAVITLSGGTEQNQSPASNWQGLRGASALLALLASDAPAAQPLLAASEGRLRTYLQANYGNFSGPNGGPGGGSYGWNIESLGYNLYPSPNGIVPAALALLRNASTDLRSACAGAPYLAVTPWVAAQRLLGGHLAHADWSDDNGNWAPEGLGGLAFAWAPPALLPGVRWAYDRLLGASAPPPPPASATDASWDRQSAGTIWSLLYYREDVLAADPASLPLWREAFLDSRGNGKYVWRSAYSYGAGDVVLGAYAKLRSSAGHGAPDDLGLRLTGLNNSFLVGGGRYGSAACGSVDCFLRSQSTLYAVDPDAPAGLNATAQAVGVLVGRAGPRSAAGGSGGSLAMASAPGALSGTGVRSHTRLLAVNFTAGAGVAARAVLADASADGAFSQFMTLDANACLIVAGGQAVELRGPDGASLRLHFVHPPLAALQLACGFRARAQPYLVLDGLYPRNQYLKAWQKGCGSGSGGQPCNFVVALSLAEAGAAHPAVAASGQWGGSALSGSVSVGDWAVSIEGQDIGSA